LNENVVLLWTKSFEPDLLGNDNMPTIEIETIIDTQGNIHLPECYRHLYGNKAKMLILLPETTDLTKPFAQSRPPTKPETLLGCVGYQGPAKSLEEMANGILEEAKRQWQKANR
jgi:hypothetical protein